jgi:hypothetical protein
VDPLSGATNTLSYHWEIFLSYANQGFGYDDMPDYHSSVFPIPVNSMPDQPDLSEGTDPDALYWRVRLEVHHIPYTPGVVPSQETIFWFRFEYFGSPVDFYSANFSSFPDLP